MKTAKPTTTKSEEKIRRDKAVREATRKAVEQIMAQRDDIIKAFIAKYGVEDPRDLIQYQQVQPDGSIAWWLEKRSRIVKPSGKPARVVLPREF